MWTAGSTISVQVISDIGMSIGQGIWSGWVALTSFLWGAFGHQFFPVFTAVTMRSRPGAFVGLALLLIGIVLLASVGGAADKVRRFNFTSSLAIQIRHLSFHCLFGESGREDRRAVQRS